jgi:hypothetical protein
MAAIAVVNSSVIPSAKRWFAEFAVRLRNGITTRRGCGADCWWTSFPLRTSVTAAAATTISAVTPASHGRTSREAIVNGAGSSVAAGGAGLAGSTRSKSIR